MGEFVYQNMGGIPMIRYDLAPSSLPSALTLIDQDQEAYLDVFEQIASVVQTEINPEDEATQNLAFTHWRS